MIPQPQTSESSTFTFTPRELQRLAIYRAAVVARFYTDQCDSIEPAALAHTHEAEPQPEAN